MRAPLRTSRSRRAAVASLALATIASVAAWVPAPAGAAPSGKGSGVLSVRLQQLAQPGLRTRSAAEQSAAVDLPRSGAGSLLARDGRLSVDLVADQPGAVAAAAAVPGASLVTTLPDGLNATISLPASSLSSLEGVAGLRSAREVLRPEVHRGAAPSAPVAPAAPAAACPTGVRSQGDTQLQAAVARATYGVDGDGITVGVLSDSFAKSPAAVKADIASGDLPGAGNPCGHTTPVKVLSDYSASDASDEGRAMLQIVHDLAPQAKLLFATAFNSDLDFANQIRALKAAGADVIVDDVGYPTETVYQDGPIGAAVRQVSAAGVAYFSAAGNGEYVVGGKSIGSYEAQAFRASACPAVITSSQCHDFDPGAGVVPYDTITLAGSSSSRSNDVQISMGWNEPINDVTTDYDLVLVDPTQNTSVGGKVVAAGGDANTSSGQPVEVLGFTNPSSQPKTYRLYVARYGVAATTTPRFKFFFGQGSLTSVQWNQDSRAGDTDVFGPTANGHSTTAGMMAVAAVPQDDRSTVEDFSSRGPATYCWGPFQGTTPATALPSCTTEQLDLAATDGVATTLPGDSGLNPFYGTSAAAPHAAAVAALMLERQPCRTNTDVYATLKSSAKPIAGFGEEAQGAGLVYAPGAVGTLAACGPFAPPAASVYVPVTPCRLADTRVGGGGPLAAGSQRAIQITGNSSRFVAQGGANGGCGVPAGATAIEASVTAVGPTGTGYLRAWPTGAGQPNATFLNYVRDRNITNTGSIALPAGAGRELTFANFGAKAHYVFDLQGYYVTPTGGSVYVPITPCRVVDTRPGSPLGPNAQRAFQVGGTGAGFAAQGGAANGCGVPASATAVEASVTATAPQGAGYFRAWPTGAATPNATFLNYGAGQGTTNTGSIALSATGTQDLTVKNYSATSDYVIDVQGYWASPANAPTGSKYLPIRPCRVVDTRSGSALTANAVRAFQVGGTGATFAAQGGAAGGCGVPEGASAVEASVTAVGPSANGYFRAWPTGVAMPNATFLNFGKGQSTTNTGSIALALAGVGDRDLTTKNFGATADYVVDVQGYFVPPSTP